MGNHQTTVMTVLQNMPPWVGLVFAHFSLSGTLSIVALVTTIAYNIVNIRYIHRRKNVAHD